MGQSPAGEDCNREGLGLPLLNGPTEFGPSHPEPTQFTTDPKKRALPGDLLFCVRGSTTGRMNWADQEYAIGRGIAAIRHMLTPKLQPLVRAVIEQHLPVLLQAATGSTFPNVSGPQLAAIPFPNVAPKDALAIAFVLGALDDKIELNRRMNETLEAMARAIFKDWFVDLGPTRAKMEGRAPYLAPDIWSLFPDRLDDEGKPEGWELRPVADFAELRGGKQLEKERITTVGTIPVFGGAGVMGFTDEHNAEGFVISVGRVGAYCGQFFSCRGKAWINNNASLIRQHEGVSGEWLFQSLQHADIEVIKKGAAQPFVSNTDVGNLPIIWPGDRVVAQFADVAVPLMLRMEHNEAEVSNLATTRDFLLPKLMSGEVRVKDAEKLVGEVA